MRAAVCPAYGPPEVIRIRELPEPVVEAGQALVRVHAAAVNFPDVLFVADDYQFSVPPPFVPGSEFAGTVLAVGDAVDDLQPGDRVSGSTLVGAFAEQVAIAAGSLQPVPEGVDLRDAAAFGVAHSTAHHVLRSVARVEEAEDLIVLGAGGGVGLATVQLGALLGATVTAVASTDEKLRVAASHGARHLIRHHDVDLRAALREVLPDGADVVVDPVGGALA
nr:zinc-binding dehydrogenase [Actinomycetota bacterium]NIS28690.1 zinc-binding dehydrogenase [Actinomycetota bacterium]NIT94092.1 zinc-binding dehydrogenase [Actinomycetota bacterium]NIU17717.1 zinc-binding dehydrogenase [Actinomycetota bacterium]NIU64154.1 zinc-binding dehydrogenase [Actinomycetota bacterium]